MSNDASNDVKSNAGRPTKLTPELKAKAQEYLYDFRANEDVVPSIAGLACYLSIAKSSIYKYKDEDAEFSDTLEAIENLQEKMLLNGGLMGDFNPTITKLMMSNHGYSDKQEVDNRSSDNSMRPVFNIVGVSPDDTKASGDSTE